MKHLHVMPYYLSITFVLISVSAGRPLTSLFAEHLEAPIIQIGVIAASYSILPLLFAVSVGLSIDRLGTKKPIMFGSLGTATALSVPFFVPSLVGLLIAQMMWGISQMLTAVALQKGVGSAATRKSRDLLIGQFSMFASIGMFLGPLIGGYVTEHFGYRSTFLTLSVLSLTPFICALFLDKQPVNPDLPDTHKGFFSQASEVKDLLKIPAVGRSIGVSLFVLASIDMFQVYFPLYVQSLGMSTTQIGWLLAVQAAAAVFIRFFIPVLVGRFGRVKVLWMFMLLGAVAYGMISAFHHFSLFIFLCMMLGMGLGICQPLTTVLTYNAVHRDRTGEALAVRQAGNRLGQIVIPFAMAGISQLTGLGMIFTLQALFLLFGVWVARGIKQET